MANIASLEEFDDIILSTYSDLLVYDEAYIYAGYTRPLELEPRPEWLDEVFL